MKHLLIILVLFLGPLSGEEMVIGKKSISPGIEFIFEAAPKDAIFPNSLYLSENETDIHIEMLASWKEDNLALAPSGSFIAYLEVEAIIKNINGTTNKVNLTPHLNLIDNLHYAQNIKLPGSIDDSYDVTFKISPPRKEVLGIHFDWNEKFGELIKETSFTFQNLNFKKIALKTRR
jgi:uncharacterized protein involved in high-affinity Fe2+ transport